MKLLFRALMLVAGISMSSAYAQNESVSCKQNALTVLAQDARVTGLMSAINDDGVIAAECKTWPFNESLLLMAVAYDRRVAYEKAFLLAIFDKKSQEVVSLYERKIREDAVTQVDSSSFRFDTAKYDLNSKTRAFGLVFKTSAHGANCADNYWGDELTLFVPDGVHLRSVVTINRYWQRWLKGCPNAIRDSVSEEAYLKLTLAQSKKNGFRDIIVTAYRSPLTTVRGQRLGVRRLQFDGKIYKVGGSVPWWLAHQEPSF